MKKRGFQDGFIRNQIKFDLKPQKGTNFPTKKAQKISSQEGLNLQRIDQDVSFVEREIESEAG